MKKTGSAVVIIHERLLLTHLLYLIEVQLLCKRLCNFEWVRTIKIIFKITNEVVTKVRSPTHKFIYSCAIAILDCTWCGHYFLAQA